MQEPNDTLVLVAENLTFHKSSCLDLQIQSIDKAVLMLLTEKQHLTYKNSNTRKD